MEKTFKKQFQLSIQVRDNNDLTRMAPAWLMLMIDLAVFYLVSLISKLSVTTTDINIALSKLILTNKKHRKKSRGFLFPRFSLISKIGQECLNHTKQGTTENTRFLASQVSRPR